MSPRKVIPIILLSLLFCCTLPSLNYWQTYPTKAESKTSNPKVINIYQHPPLPVVNNQIKPQITSSNYILVDNATNTILTSSYANERIYPASITKLATAITALNIYPLDEVITVGTTYSDGKVMNLVSGENITVKSLVNALLVYSANDAAYNLAVHHRDGVIGFVKEMNLINSQYGLKDTNFTNFDGIHNPNHYSSVYDLAKLGRLAFKNPIIKDVVKKKQITVTDISGDISHTLDSTNELLDITSEIEGLKTGWTPEAKGCFIALLNINGHYLISVVAKSDDRFSDTTKILQWAKNNVVWRPYQP